MTVEPGWHEEGYLNSDRSPSKNAYGTTAVTTSGDAVVISNRTPPEVLYGATSIEVGAVDLVSDRTPPSTVYGATEIRETILIESDLTPPTNVYGATAIDPGNVDVVSTKSAPSTVYGATSITSPFSPVTRTYAPGQLASANNIAYPTGWAAGGSYLKVKRCIGAGGRGSNNGGLNSPAVVGGASGASYEEFTIPKATVLAAHASQYSAQYGASGQDGNAAANTYLKVGTAITVQSGGANSNTPGTVTTAGVTPGTTNSGVASIVGTQTNTTGNKPAAGGYGGGSPGFSAQGGGNGGNSAGGTGGAGGAPGGTPTDAASFGPGPGAGGGTGFALGFGNVGANGGKGGRHGGGGGGAGGGWDTPGSPGLGGEGALVLEFG